MIQQDHFFKLYGAFLSIDEKFALINGRRRDIIKKFYIWYNDLDSFSQAQQEDLLKTIISYAKDCSYQVRFQNIARSTAIPKKDSKDLHNAQTLNQESCKIYIQWRKALKDNASILAVENCVDRVKYYFSLEDKGIKQIKEILDCKIDDSTSIIIPRQFLMEFHNAISHLYYYYYASGKSDNIPRACNHFKRGALDLHKIIIKDFFVLVEKGMFLEEKDSIQEKLFKVRSYEYKSIGNDQMKTNNTSKNNPSRKVFNLFENYHDLTQNIVKIIQKR